MKRSRFTAEQIIGVLREAEAGAETAAARPRGDAIEGDAIALGLLLDPFAAEIIDDDRGEVVARRIGLGAHEEREWYRSTSLIL